MAPNIRWSCVALTFAVTSLALVPAAGATFGELVNGAPPVPPAGPYYAAGPYASEPLTCPPECFAAPPPVAGPVAGPPVATPPGSVVAAPGAYIGLAPGTSPYLPPLAAAPRAFLPFGPYSDQPDPRLQLWSFGQINATTDPYDPWGFSTPYMYVPWSTPLSGWANAATWNWWRERSGALPRNW